jgi:hypothetical protein
MDIQDKRVAVSRLGRTAAIVAVLVPVQQVAGPEDAHEIQEGAEPNMGRVFSVVNAERR